MTCSDKGCERSTVSRGMCKVHYSRALRRGMARLPRPTPEELFWSKVDRGSDDRCWGWTAHLDRDGYGEFRWTPAPLDKRGAGAHRFAYELLVGPIPEGLTIDHLCVNRACVNPSHMEPVTTEENSRRAAERRTHCANGHEWTPANTYMRSTGARQCRVCNRAAAARYVARRSVAS